MISQESETLPVDSPGRVEKFVQEAAATNILQVHINWLWEAGSGGTVSSEKVDEDRKLDGSHLTQKTARRAAGDGEALLCIINELSSSPRSSETRSG